MRSVEALESRLHLAFSTAINFQPGGTPPPGYIVDKGEQYGTRVGGWTYGWNIQSTKNVFKRNSPLSPDLRYDTVALMQAPSVANWNMIVPNGTYTIHIVAGDPASTTGNVYKIAAEGVTVVDGTPTADRPWVEGTATITVADKKLTLTNVAGAVGNRIAFMEISDGGTVTPPPPTVPAVPGSFAAAAQSSTQIKLTWADVATETGYKLERSADGMTGWAQIATPAANATSYVDSNLAASTKYFYRLLANNAVGDSSHTATVNATTQAVVLTPPPPATDIDLQFNAAAGGINGTGFTGVLATSKGKGLVTGNVAIGSGQLRLTTTAGDFAGTRNNQDDALNLPFNSARDFVIDTRLTSFPFTANWQNAGVFVGQSEDKFVKLVAAYSGGAGIQLGSETGAAVFTSVAWKGISPANFQSLDLRLRGTFSTKSISAQYRLNSSDDTTWVTVGNVVNADAFNAAAKAGVVSTNLGSSPVTASFNWFTAGGEANQPPPPPPPPPVGIPITIGMNLDGLAEYSTIAPFNDLSTMFKPWGSVAAPYQTEPNLPLTEKNYPLADAGTITYANGYPDGDYQVSYAGQANLSFTGLSANFQVTSSANGITTGVLHLEPQSNPGILSMFVTGVDAANPLHDLHIISPDANPAISPTFRPVFLNKLAPFDGYLRMMDWMQTFGSNMENFNQRTPVDRFSYIANEGVPYEVIAELANELDRDLWINIPVKATDDYVHQLAQFFRDRMPAGRHLYVEYSDELWATWNQPSALVNLGYAQNDPQITKTDPWGQSAQRTGKRTAQIAQIFRQEFGDARYTSQVRPVLNGCVAGASWSDIALQYVKDHFPGPVSDYICTNAVSVYVGVINDFAPIDNDSLTLDKLFAWSHNWIDTTLSGWIKQSKQVADKWGLAFDSYEAGQAFEAPQWQNEPLKRAAQDDPRMGDVYTHLVKTWTKLSDGGVFGNFALANPYSHFGYWGVLKNIMLPGSVKYDAIKALVDQSV